ncbi:hypothetical protein FJNA_23510 [Thermus sp. FJN-A]
MWRRGEGVYALIVASVVSLEALALGGLVLVFSARLWGAVGYGPVAWTLWQSLALTGLALGVLSGYVLLYHTYTAWREGRARAAYQAWLARFTEALLEEKEPPSPPWPEEAVEALLALRESLRGEYGERLSAWLREVLPRWRRRLLGRFASRATRLEALDALAQARLAEALPLVLPYLRHPDPVLRLAAARAASRLAPKEAALALASGLLQAALPRGALLEVLLLLEDRADPVVRHFLEEGGGEEAWAALEALGRLRLLGLAGEAERFLHHPDPELRAAAMRALARLGYAPEGLWEVVLAHLQAPEDFLRLQAVRLLPLVGGEVARRALWRALSDPSFYVRRGAAEALRSLDPGLLRQAAQAHPDPYGRAMAEQVLRKET